MPSRRSRSRSCAIVSWFCAATLATARSSSDSSILVPVSRALVTSTRSSISTSSTSLRSVAGGGSWVRLRCRLGAHPGDPLLHLGGRDQLLVDHGDDVVGGGLRLHRRARPAERQRQRRRPGRGGEAESSQSYGVNVELVVRSSRSSW